MGSTNAHASTTNEGNRRYRPGVRRALVTVMLVAAACMLAVAPALGDSARFKASGSAGDYSWSPSSRTISKGDRIVWKNPTDSRHTVTAYSGSWNKNTEIQPGEKTRKKFRNKGTFKFRCMVQGHSDIQNGRCVGMCGVVKVQ